MTMLERMEQMMRGEIPPPGIGLTLGMAMTKVAAGVAVFEVTTDERFYNPMGTVHGGILCDIADAAMGVAYASTLDDGESFTTLELKINFMRPVWRARLTAEGRVLQRGKTVGVTEARIMDEEGRLVAYATSTCLTLSGVRAEGR